MSSNSSAKTNRIYMLIMNILTQVAFMVPWIEFDNRHYSAITYAVRLATSGDLAGVLREDICSFNMFENGSWNDVRLLAIIFTIQIVMMVLAQFLCLMCAVVLIVKRRLMLRYYVYSIFLVTISVVLYIQSPIMASDSMLMNWYTFFLLCGICLIIMGERMIAAWRENEAQYQASRQQARELRHERRERLEFEGRYGGLFMKTVWKNFLYNWKTYRIFVLVSSMSVALIYAGFSLKEILSSTYSHENLIMGQGLGTILVGFIEVVLAITAFLIISVLMFYLKTHVRGYGMFVTLGMRRKTLYSFIAIELVSCMLISLVLGLVFGNVIRVLCCRGMMKIGGAAFALGAVTYRSYLYSVEASAALFVISVLLTHELYIDTGASTTGKRAVEREKIPGVVSKYALALGIILMVLGMVRYMRLENFESTKMLCVFFAGLFLTMFFGTGIYLKKRACDSDRYFGALLERNQYYYKYRTTMRYLFLFTLVNVGILFVFGKGLASAVIATPAEEQFPYDFVCMATESDYTLFDEIEAEYDIEKYVFPMVRVSNVDNTTDPDVYAAPMFPQGQEIGISESTYRELCRMRGWEAGEFELAEDGSTIGVVFQQDQSVESHPLDYFVNLKTPYLHIGQPVENYDSRQRDNVFPCRTISWMQEGSLIGSFRQGRHENIVVFNDKYFESVQNEWMNCDISTGMPVEGEAVEGVNIHHWPDRLVIINAGDEDLKDIEGILSGAFEGNHEFDNKIDSTVLSHYYRTELVEERASERIMNMMANGLIVLILMIVSMVLMYLKSEAELVEKRRQYDFLKCMGMSRKERAKLLRREREEFLWIPMLLGTVISAVFTVAICALRGYESADWIAYMKVLAVLYLVNLTVQISGTKLFEALLLRKVEGR